MKAWTWTARFKRCGDQPIVLVKIFHCKELAASSGEKVCCPHHLGKKSAVGIRHSIQLNYDQCKEDFTLSRGKLDFCLFSDDSHENFLQGYQKDWSHEKTMGLISLYQEHKHLFSNNLIKKKEIWVKIANGLQELGETSGAPFTADECDRKWRNLKDRYKRIVDSSKQTGRGKSIQWAYFDALNDVLQSDPAVNPPVLMTVGSTSQTVINVDTSSPSSSKSNECSDPLCITPPPGSAKRKRRRSSSTEKCPQWAQEFMDKADKSNKKMRKQLKKLAKEERRRNDLFQQFLQKLQ